jgi:hypothetical protein
MVWGIAAVIAISFATPAGLNQIAPVFGVASWENPAPVDAAVLVARNDQANLDMLRNNRWRFAHSVRSELRR